MFRKSVIKIMATIMAVMVIMLAVTLTVIYVTSASEIYRENQERLETYIEAYEENGNPDGAAKENISPDAQQDNLDPDTQQDNLDSDALQDNMDPDTQQDNLDEPPADDPPDQAYVLSTFYSVLFRDDEVTEIDNSDDKLYSDEQIQEFASAILNLEKGKGTWHNLVYRVAEVAEGDTLVVMMDNTVIDQSVFAFFRYTLLYGGIALVILLFVSFFLARRIVRPLQDGYERQKRFISDAGHELKTPVSAMGANLDILKREVGDNRWIENIEYENRRMVGIVTQLLELSRAETTQPAKTKVDFSRLVTSEVLSFESVAFERGFIFDTEAIADGVQVHGNEEQLSQLVSVLLDNAVDHADGSISEHIVVSLQERRGKAVLTVSNAGAPIPEAEREQIFERFYRSDGARSGEGSHYGLGLSIAKAIVLAHHGTIRLTCKEERILFTVVL